ncbi:hypothetical protein, partial [Mesorhizobium tianshanense]|uniref:hypothetical protein n=1 Tax=Mesorhizobium tianshanense TaxID=39844 RepID=UPI0024E070A4
LNPNSRSTRPNAAAFAPVTSYKGKDLKLFNTYGAVEKQRRTACGIDFTAFFQGAAAICITVCISVRIARGGPYPLGKWPFLRGAGAPVQGIHRVRAPARMAA